MADTQYYTQIRGEAHGPYSEDEMYQLVRNRKLGRMHRISTDRATWRRAEEFPQFFEVVTPDVANLVAPDPGPRMTVRPGPAVDTVQAAQHDGSAKSEATAKPAPAKPDASAGEYSLTPQTNAGTADVAWYYVRDGVQAGPATTAQLQAWVASGALPANGPVWRHGMPGWLPLQQVPELQPPATAAPARPPPRPTATRPEVEWYFQRDGERAGPVPQSRLTAMIAAHELTPYDMVWSEGLSEWMPIQSLPGLAPRDESAPLTAVSQTPQRRQPRTDFRERYRGHSGLAIACLVISLIQVCGLNCPIAIVFGIASIQQILRSNGQLQGMGFAIAGMSIAVVTLLGWVSLFLWFLP